MDDIKAECMFNELLHVKEEEVHIKEEPEWQDHASVHSISAAAARAGLYANHEVKNELVLGPEDLQPADIAFTLYAAQDGEQPVARDCVVKFERSDDLDDSRRAESTSHVEHADLGLGIINSAGSSDALAGASGRGRTSTGGHSHCCEICNKNFTHLSRLKAHERTHTGEKPFTCRTCNKKFMQLGHLNSHTRIHSGPYSCGVCTKAFTQSSDLKRHARTHTGEKPFSCSICDKKYTKSYRLKKHVRIHTGEKPFSCGICKWKFAQSNTLKIHERTHRRKTFSCRTCKKKFTTSSNLKKHGRAHT